MTKPAKNVTKQRSGDDSERLAEQQAERLKEKAAKQMASRIPKPTGYKLLVALPEPEEKTEGGIIKAAETIAADEIGSVVGYVMAMGPDAYADKKRFPSGAYCKVGDWILMRTYSGTRFLVDGKELRLLSDDSIEAVVEDPRSVKRR